MNRLSKYFKTHSKMTKIIFLAYIVFAACFVFPFANEYFPFDFVKAYLVIASYGIIGLGLSGVYGAHKEKIVYLITLVLTGLGMMCRYILEYGEVSNTMNFTSFNIVSYLIIIPVLTVFAYHFIVKHLMKTS